jgi:hypothetical protein
MRMGGDRRLVAAIVLASLACPGCALVPGELNLSPLYRHRLDEAGNVLELDVLWPVFHWERTAAGGSDFRIRPLYRRVSEPSPEPGTEHQFLWPLGRVRTSEEETASRLFPLWSYASRINDKGERDVDWNLALLVWAGHDESGTENYLAVLPFYADIPGFLTYDRFQTHLFPLHVYTEKNGKSGHQFLWPLIGFGGNESGTVRWHRVLPLYGVSIDEERFARYSVLWPFVHWGTENADLESAHDYFLAWPLFGVRSGAKVSGWTFLWPLFSKVRIGERYYKLDVLWPFYRRHIDRSESTPLDSWWLWPFVGRTETADQRAWTFLWPLIWLREYDDPEGTLRQTWVIPFHWSSHRERSDGGKEDFVKWWPLFHRERRDGEGTREWSALSPWPWRAGNAYGIEEAYGWLWTLAKGRSAADDSSMHLAGHLFTTRERRGRRQTSVPFLFNYESGASGSVLRLFQFLPIPLGGGATPATDGEVQR